MGFVGRDAYKLVLFCDTLRPNKFYSIYRLNIQSVYTLSAMKFLEDFKKYLPWFVDFWYYIFMIVLFIVLAIIFL